MPRQRTTHAVTCPSMDRGNQTVGVAPRDPPRAILGRHRRRQPAGLTHPVTSRQAGHGPTGPRARAETSRPLRAAMARQRQRPEQARHPVDTSTRASIRGRVDGRRNPSALEFRHRPVSLATGRHRNLAQDSPYHSRLDPSRRRLRIGHCPRHYTSGLRRSRKRLGGLPTVDNHRRKRTSRAARN